jgi:hypothetical protein
MWWGCAFIFVGKSQQEIVHGRPGDLDICKEVLLKYVREKCSLIAVNS